MRQGCIEQGVAVRLSQHLVKRCDSLFGLQFLVVFHQRERIVKMVQQLAPFCISIGLPKSDRMILKRSPRDKQQIAVWRLDAFAQIKASKPGCRFNQGTGPLNRRLKCGFLTRSNIENRHFKHHE